MYLNTSKTKHPQIARWAVQLSEFNAKIRHRTGTEMGHVNALSRAPTNVINAITMTRESEERYESDPGERESENESHDTRKTARKSKGPRVQTLVSDDDDIAMFQANDVTIARKRAILRIKPSKRTPSEANKVENFALFEGLLYRVEERKKLYEVPNALRKSLTIRFHDMRSHPGIERTVRQMGQHYHFRGMRRYVRQHVRECIQCTVTKSKPGRQRGELHPIPPGVRPFATIHVDHSGPYVTSGRQKRYVLAIIDYLTRFVVLHATRDTKTSQVIRALNEFVLTFGAPIRIVSDRGTCFTAAKFSEFCETHGIRHTLTSPRHPQANGMIERVNATLLPAIVANLKREDG